MRTDEVRSELTCYYLEPLNSFVASFQEQVEQMGGRRPRQDKTWQLRVSRDYRDVDGVQRNGGWKDGRVERR